MGANSGCYFTKLKRQILSNWYLQKSQWSGIVYDENVSCYFFGAFCGLGMIGVGGIFFFVWDFASVDKWNDRTKNKKRKRSLRREKNKTEK